MSATSRWSNPSSPSHPRRESAKAISESHPYRRLRAKGFGSSGQLKVDGKIFAMLVRGELVLKLPGDRVDALIASGDRERFDAGKGKPMREWFVLSVTSRKSWRALANEAMAFVAGRAQGAP